MIETDILTALSQGGKDAIATLDAPMKDWPLKAVDMQLQSPNEQAEQFFEFVHIPNNRPGDYLGDERTYQGIFRIMVHMQLPVASSYAGPTICDALAAFFPKEKRLISGAASVEIYTEPNYDGSIRSGAELIFPLTLRYRCFRP